MGIWDKQNKQNYKAIEYLEVIEKISRSET